MKKIIAFAFAAIITNVVLGQSEKYIKAMESKMAAIDTTRTVAELSDLANTFERIADAEKTQWLPYYYAALAQVNAGMMIANSNGMSGGTAALSDPRADKAEELLNKAIALGKDNSETWLLKKQIASLRMLGDPMNRYMTYGPIADEALKQAKKLNPENPRVYLIEGQDKFFTPEQYGGSKTEARKLFELSLSKYDSYKPESSIHPSWGKGQARYFLSMP